MVAAHCGAAPPADAGAAAPARVEFFDASRALDGGYSPPCPREGPGLLSEAGADVLLEELWCQVKHLWEEASRLCSIRVFTGDGIFSGTQQLEKPLPPSAVEKRVVSTPTTEASETSGEECGSDYGDLRMVIKTLGALVMFSSVWVNSWLQNWCEDRILGSTTMASSLWSSTCLGWMGCRSPSRWQ